MNKADLERMNYTGLGAILAHYASSGDLLAMLGILHTVLNRSKSQRDYGRGLAEIILSYDLFSEPEKIDLDAVEDRAFMVSFLALNHHTLSPVGRATHYFDKDGIPPWVSSSRRLQYVKTIRQLAFYREMTDAECARNLD